MDILIESINFNYTKLTSGNDEEYLVKNIYAEYKVKNGDNMISGNYEINESQLDISALKSDIKKSIKEIVDDK